MKNKYISNIVASFLYSLVYYIIYIKYLNLNWDYFGYVIHQRSPFIWFLTFCFAIAPILFYRGIIAISSFISIFIYLILYIPSVITFTFALKVDEIDLTILQIVFMLGMCLWFYADRKALNFNLNRKIYNKDLLRIILISSILITLYLIWTFRGNLKLVSFDEVYIQRSANSGLIGSVFGTYFISWLATFFAPFSFTYGLFYKKKVYLIVGLISSLFLYAASAAKGTLLMPGEIFVLYLFFTKVGVNRFSNIVIYLFSVFSIILLLLTNGNKIISWVSTIFFMRTISIGGLLNVTYYDFFTTHPYTYFSHINIVNFFTGAYVYGNKSLGEVIGKYYLSDDINSNANFMATDGIASGGLLGLLIISILFYIFLIMINGITKGYNKIFIVLLFIPFVGTLLNTSLFSSLLSGGGFLLILTLIYLDKKVLTS